ncbi:hypothetical protein [Cognatishimia sp. F0-27]|uniref:hypothetical protein n=1 Tax=Cognatishimia sp. F0-27 TaxID=2816855 RepID=UPI001D0CC906|nr:hypothetical protein [Cognatishimia sp. F0-27]MCC1492297.1 hypothetical protein [Cognatishimia sp. F0-27]
MGRDDVEAWVETYRARVLDQVRAIDGFRAVEFLVAREGDPAAVTVLTTWDDMGSVRAFAGDDPARTVLPDFMVRFFTSHDARATFYDQVLLETTP